ncbi:MAG: MCE family protein [Xanthomonadales bacterium]|nr:MCE family protein [Xanthomonadales bacterium]
MRNTQLIVGLFVSAAIAVFIAITLWLSGRHGGEPTETYSMYFQNDVSGLMMGGPVFYLGVEVGSVTRMDIIPGDPIRIRVDAEVLASTPIDTGTYASLAYQGVTGVAVINLYGDPGMNLPLKTPPGEEHPVIEVRDAGLAALLSDAPGLIEKLNRLLDQAGQLVGPDNRARVSGTLENVEALTARLRDQEQSFAELPATLNATLTDIQSTLADLRDAAAEVRPGISDSMAHLEKVTADLARLTGRLDEWTDDNGEDMQHFLDNGLGQVPDLVADARKMLREAEKLLKELRDNPSSLLYKPADASVELEQ